MLSFKEFFNESTNTGIIDSFYDQETKQEITNGKSVTAKYVHNPVKSGYYGKEYAQNIEPAGKYINLLSPNIKPSDHLESGTITFQKPLVLHWAGYGETGWKNFLYKKFKKKGMALTNALMDMGYDGIITVSHNSQGMYSSECVILKKF